MTSDGGSFAHLGLHVGTDWRVGCNIYEDRMPILSVDAGRSAVSFSITEGSPDTAAVAFARALAREAQAFAAEVERLHAAQPDCTGNDDKAADVDAA